MQQYHAVIMAGGKSPWLEPLAGTPYRIMARLGNKRILDRLVSALRASGRIDRIVLVAPREAVTGQSLPEGIETAEPGQSLPDTAWAGARQLQDGDKLLFVTDDIPFLTGAAVAYFLARCEEAPEMQLQYPLVPKAVCERACPGAHRTYIHFREGAFTGGNLTLCDRNIIPRGQAVAHKIFSLRKRPWQMASWVGLGFILRMVFRLVDFPEANRRASGMTEFRCRAIPVSYAEVGMDLDKAEDWQEMIKWSGQRESDG